MVTNYFYGTYTISAQTYDVLYTYTISNNDNLLIDDLGNYIVTDDNDFLVMSIGPVPSPTPTTTPTPSITPQVTATVTPTPTTSAAALLSCYVAGPLTADTSNGAVFDRSINVSGVLEVIAGAVGGNVAVPDEFSKKSGSFVPINNGPISNRDYFVISK